LLAGVVAGALFIWGWQSEFNPLHRGSAKSTLGLQRHETPIDLAPFFFLDPQGKTHTLEEWKGQVVLVNLWGTWCPPCRKEMPALNRLQADLQGETITVLAINLDHSGQISPSAWLREQNLLELTAYHGWDRSILKATKARLVPTTLIIDREGHEVARVTGAIDWDEKRYRMMIAYFAQ
jgi:thiol-disulfide isomerase/thioredoxin